MSSSATYIDPTPLLTHHILTALHAYLPQNAIFWAERLHAHKPTQQSTYLLARCFIATNQKHRARKYTNEECVRAAAGGFEANTKIEDLEGGEGLLDTADDNRKGKKRNHSNNNSEAESGNADSMKMTEKEKKAFQLAQRGLIEKKSSCGVTNTSPSYLLQSLKLNPFLWSSLEALIQQGVEISIPEFLDKAKPPGSDPVVAWALRLMGIMGMALQRIHLHDPQSALELYNQLEPAQFETAYVNATLARCFSGNRKDAQLLKYFAIARHLDPFRMEDMDIYSSALFQLNRRSELAALARDLLGKNRHSPQAWVAVGNIFGLEKAHASAVKCFKRSIEIDPTYGYAWYLMGMENLSNDDFEKSAKCFREALKCDARMFQAWYGLGSVYKNEKKHAMAEIHYRKALDLQPNDPIFLQYLGMTLTEQHKWEEALDAYTRALELNPQLTQCMYNKGKLLMLLDDEQSVAEAQALFERALELRPDEPKICEAMGELLSGQHDFQRSVEYYLNAASKYPDDKYKRRAMDNARMTYSKQSHQSGQTANIDEWVERFAS